MLDEWQRRFSEDGEVTIHLGRRRAVLTAVIAAVFLLAGVGLLVVPAAGAATRGLDGLRPVAAAAGLLLGLVGGAVALRSLVRPLVVVRLDREGVAVPMNPGIPWEDVVDVGEVRLTGQRLVTVETSDAYAVRAAAAGGARGRLARMNAGIIGPGRVSLRPGAQGGDEAVAALLRWAHRRMVGDGRHHGDL
jgi:hypothetical protein